MVTNSDAGGRGTFLEYIVSIHDDRVHNPWEKNPPSMEHSVLASDQLSNWFSRFICYLLLCSCSDTPTQCLLCILADACFRSAWHLKCWLLQSQASSLNSDYSRERESSMRSHPKPFTSSRKRHQIIPSAISFLRKSLSNCWLDTEFFQKHISNNAPPLLWMC